MTYVVKANRAIQLMSLDAKVLMGGDEVTVEEITDELKRAERWGSITITQVVEKKVTTEKKWKLPKEESAEVPAETPKEPVTPSEPESSEEASEEEEEEEPEEE